MRPTMTMTLTCDHRAVAGRLPPTSCARSRPWSSCPASRCDVIRRGGQQDVPFMRDMLRHAYYWRWVDPELEDLPVSRYVDRWGRQGDTALVLIERFRPVGAAWYRLFKGSEPGYGFVDEQTPELTIAVVPSCRGNGLRRPAPDRTSRPRPRGRLPADQPQRREGQPRRQALRAPRLRDRGRGRGRLHHGRRSRAGRGVAALLAPH